MNRSKLALITLILAGSLTSGYAQENVETDVYSLPSNYESLSAKEKLNVLYEKLLATKYPTDQLPQDPTGRSASYTKLGKAVNLLRMDRRNRVFEKGDVLAKEDKMDRITHYYGSVMKVKMVPTQLGLEKGYTGYFSQEAEGLARFSSAVGVMAQPRTPSLALKFPISGVDKHYGTSANVVAINEPNGYGPHFGDKLPESTPFFEKSLSFNTTLGPAVRLGAKYILFPRFQDSVKSTESTLVTYGHHLSTFAVAKFSADGTVLSPEQVKNPYSVSFKPSGALLQESFQNESGSHKDKDYRILLNDIKVGDELFEVYAYENETDTTGTLIGKIFASSENINSAFGDAALRFQHDAAFESIQDTEHSSAITCPVTGRSVSKDVGLFSSLINSVVGYFK